MIRQTCVALTGVMSIILSGIHASPQDAGTKAESHKPKSLLARHYQEGEKLSYHMTASNRERDRTLLYEIQAEAIVKRDENGYIEEFAWSNLVVNGKPVMLPPPSLALRQMLSLMPNPKLAIPDLSKVHPMMIGPITDMLSFYADMRILKTQGNLTRAGDHFYFKHGTPNSWADGMYVTLGQDSIDLMSRWLRLTTRRR